MLVSACKVVVRLVQRGPWRDGLYCCRDKRQTATVSLAHNTMAIGAMLRISDSTCSCIYEVMKENFIQLHDKWILNMTPLCLGSYRD